MGGGTEDGGLGVAKLFLWLHFAVNFVDIIAWVTALVFVLGVAACIFLSRKHSKVERVALLVASVSALISLLAVSLTWYLGTRYYRPRWEIVLPENVTVTEGKDPMIQIPLVVRNSGVWDGSLKGKEVRIKVFPDSKRGKCFVWSERVGFQDNRDVTVPGGSYTPATVFWSLSCAHCATVQQVKKWGGRAHYSLEVTTFNDTVRESSRKKLVLEWK